MFKTLMSFDVFVCAFMFIVCRMALFVCCIHQTFNLFLFLMFRLNSCNSKELFCVLFLSDTCDLKGDT